MVSHHLQTGPGAKKTDLGLKCQCQLILCTNLELTNLNVT